MRLHALSLTAFGPFPGTERIDFDDLNEAGLFLLAGPTGAGKTSILDAVCFALFGSVPGVRGVKALKSQHAEPQTRPEVELEFSIAGRRFVVRRSPEWARPKLRGSGLLTEKATATLVETTSGLDHLLSSRAQEVGHQISELVGMNAGQFAQVAMLPQGEFQRFLRATTQDRHDVLQHLFKTDRFARIEEWVADHSRTLRERSSAGEAVVRRILDTAADRAGLELPEELADLTAPGVHGQVLPFLDRTVQSVRDRLSGLAETHGGRARRLAEARAAHREADRLAALHHRLERARQVLATLESEQETDEAARAALENDRRATRCEPVLRLLDDASAQHEQLRHRCADATAELREVGPVLETPTAEALTQVERDLRSRITRIEGLLPRERARADASRGIVRIETELETVTTARSENAARAEALPEELAAARAQLADARRRAARSEALTLSLQQARERQDAAHLLAAELPKLLPLQDACRDARDRAASAREHLQDVIAARLAGMAAELAGRLEDGQPCLVCGSAAHPDPAELTSGAVTEEEHERAAADFDGATDGYAAAERAVAEAQRHLDALRQASGRLPPEEADRAVSLLELALAEATGAAERCRALEEEVAGLLTEQRTLADRDRDQAMRAATLAEQLEQQRGTVREVTAELVAATGTDREAGSEPLSATLAKLHRSLAAATAACQALTATDKAGDRVAEVQAQAVATAHEQGFPDLATARESILPEDERVRLQAAVDARSDARVAASATLDDDDVAAVVDAPPPDVAAVREALAVAEESERLAARELHQVEGTLAALVGQRARLAEALEEWIPAQTRSARAESMSRLVRGMGGDNQLQMRLSAYVLATRLDQVLDAANERLASMRDQRYLLQRTGRAARKGSQAGLGLEVIDQWTGDVRDPATLSGGETFVVSLSLALGLADVVTQEAGGSEIHTLFVDEGFGTLDADTLDDVMDRLDGLRAGGRTVGVVSHVPELRNRIPAQIHVDKHRNGSTIAVGTLVG